MWCQYDLNGNICERHWSAQFFGGGMKNGMIRTQWATNKQADQLPYVIQNCANKIYFLNMKWYNYKACVQWVANFRRSSRIKRKHWFKRRILTPGVKTCQAKSTTNTSSRLTPVRVFIGTSCITSGTRNPRKLLHDLLILLHFLNQTWPWIIERDLWKALTSIPTFLLQVNVVHF